MTLLLEKGCNIGQKLPCDGSERSPFRCYLESLPKKDSNLATKVCQQFRRLAADESASDFAKFYLTGQSPDLRDDKPFDELEFETTALHDAVMASNYDVVEYLVRTDFIINVRDNMGRTDNERRTALQLANSLTYHLAKGENGNNRIKNNQIIALLKQSKSIASHQGPFRGLPVGWEEVKPVESPVTGAVDQQSQANSILSKVPVEAPNSWAQSRTRQTRQRKTVPTSTGYGLSDLSVAAPVKANGISSSIEPTQSVVTHESEWRMHKFLDLNKPLLMQVWTAGFSKEFYLQQVHRPRHYSGGGSAPVFGNFLEPLSKSSWWIVPFVWLPPVLLMTYMAWTQLSPTQTAKYWLLGHLLWSFIEYTIHRFIFHCDRLLPDNRLAITLHFLVHGLHHYPPMDKHRLIRPPTLTIIFGFPLYLLAHQVFFWDWYVATAVISGAGFGYICFEITHYLLHHKPVPSYYRHLKQYHLQHHYADYENGFGVTTPFWDIVFATKLDPPQAAKAK